ncbi:hypothetical protein H8E77_11785 [bacterium]|nr:hypothetical protein [bacterium]
MAIYWHPFLIQFLRQDYSSLLDIEDEVNLGEMPLRLDLLLIPRYSDIELPSWSSDISQLQRPRRYSRTIQFGTTFDLRSVVPAEGGYLATT